MLQDDFLILLGLVPLAATKELCYLILAQFTTHPVERSVDGTCFNIESATRVANRFTPHANRRMIAQVDGANGVLFIAAIWPREACHAEAIISREALGNTRGHCNGAFGTDCTVLFDDRFRHTYFRDFNIIRIANDSANEDLGSTR